MVQPFLYLAVVTVLSNSQQLKPAICMSVQSLWTFRHVDRYFWSVHTRICILYILVVKRWLHWHLGVVFLPCTQHNCIWSYAQRFSSLTGCLTSVQHCLLIVLCPVSGSGQIDSPSDAVTGSSTVWILRRCCPKIFQQRRSDASEK